MNPVADVIVIVGFLVPALALTLCGLVGLSPVWISITVWLVWFSFIAYAFASGNELFKKLLLLGMTIIPFQLVTDFYHVSVAKTLVYDYAFFRILETPDYILVGWCCNVFLIVGYAAIRLTQRIKPWVLGVIAAPVWAVAFGWYEEMASRGHVWHYENAPLFSHVSYWVLVSFAIIFGTYAAGALWLKDKPYRYWALGGVALGIWIGVVSAIAAAILR